MPAALTAAELLTGAAEHGVPVKFARIATMQALNRNVDRCLIPIAKKPIGDAEN
jgi:hypothetical protein